MSRKNVPSFSPFKCFKTILYSMTWRFHFTIAKIDIIYCSHENKSFRFNTFFSPLLFLRLLLVVFRFGFFFFIISPFFTLILFSSSSSLRIFSWLFLLVSVALHTPHTYIRSTQTTLAQIITIFSSFIFIFSFRMWIHNNFCFSFMSSISITVFRMHLSSKWFFCYKTISFLDL